MLSFLFWGCPRRVAVGGVGDGETGSVSLYKGNLNKLSVLSFSTPRPTKSATNNNKMPPKQQQKLTFGSSSSSNKRVRDELSPPPEHASPDVIPFAHSGIWEGGSKGPVYLSFVFADNFQEHLQEVTDNHTNFASKLQSLFDTVSEQNAIITKLQEQVNELVSRPPPIPTSVEVGQPLVQPHPQQKPPQPRAPRLNKNIPGKATTTPTPTPGLKQATHSHFG
jgi:hypothetical protein